MRRRTKAREYALKILYQIDITKDDCRDCLQDFWSNYRTEKSIKDFVTSLVEGVIEKLNQIDEIITSCATNWQIKRMAVVDRNILRLSTYELLFLKDIPPKVSINEAVDIAKKYGDVNSGKFVNGIIDKINKTKRTS